MALKFCPTISGKILIDQITIGNLGRPIQQQTGKMIDAMGRSNPAADTQIPPMNRGSARPLRADGLVNSLTADRYI
jgi:hypothetical protein